VRALVVQQDHVSPPGPVGDALEGRGYDVEEFLVVPAERFAEPGVEVAFPDPTRYDVVVPMGAPWSVTSEHIAGWVAAELTLLRTAHTAGVPVLGICFGGQALAAALGGSVGRSARAEIGWTTISTSEPDLVPAGPWFSWHEDSWTAPAGAVEIARTRVAPQAFVLGRSLAVQFHPELTASQLEGWLDNGGSAYLAAQGLDAAQLLARTIQEERASAARAQALVNAFLDRVATAAAT
jgi:GMP synthase-like glutamine amidotransferase